MQKEWKVRNNNIFLQQSLMKRQPKRKSKKRLPILTKEISQKVVNVKQDKILFISNSTKIRSNVIELCPQVRKNLMPFSKKA